MRVIGILLFYLAVVFLGAALMAPVLHQLAQAAATHLPVFEGIARQPFHRYVNRCLLILGIGGMVPLLRVFQIRNRAALGYPSIRGQAKRLLNGVLVGFLGMAIVAGGALVAGTWTFVGGKSGAELAGRVAGAIATAVFVGILEETVFRGALFGILRKELGLQTALWTSSVVYAIVHFFARVTNPEQINWNSGFLVLGQMLRGFGELSQIIPGFLTLTFAGAFLALAYEHTRSVGSSRVDLQACKLEYSIVSPK